MDQDLQDRVKFILDNMTAQKKAMGEIQRSIITDTQGVVEQNKRLLSTIAQLKSELDRLGNREGQTTDAMRQMKAELEEAKEALQQRTDDLNARTDELSDLQEEINETAAEVQKAKIQRDQAQQLADEYGKRTANTETSKAALQSQLQSLTDMIDQKDGEIEKLEARIAELKNEGTKCRSDIQKLRDESNQLHAQYELLQTEMKEKQKELEDVSSRMQECTDALKEAQADNDKLRRDYEELKTQNEDAARLRQELDDKMANLKQSIAAELDHIAQQKIVLIDEPVQELRKTAAQLTRVVQQIKANEEAESFIAPFESTSSSVAVVSPLVAATPTVTPSTTTMPRRSERSTVMKLPHNDPTVQKVFNWIVDNISLGNVSKESSVSMMRALSTKLIAEKMGMDIDTVQSAIDSLLLDRYLKSANAAGPGGKYVTPAWNDTLVKGEVVYWPHPLGGRKNGGGGGVLPPIF